MLSTTSQGAGHHRCLDGAIMIAALLLTGPSLPARAIPFRPLSLFTHDPVLR
jgi:hypothetical protein